MIELDVIGTPAPQGSKRHVGGGRMVESSKKVKPWRNAIEAEALNHTFDPWPYVGVAVVFRLKRPKSHYRTGRFADQLKSGAPLLPAKYPDLDKLCRSTLDGLKAGQAFGDDAQVVILDARKVYAEKAEQPGARIRLFPAL
ncbi:RusA family crossover junction endodeoxyribonuclease [Streptomyces sp. MBT56]|uniref:RusA family crossover junction endodeoxyribonuclease n=1 Tax=unclassified Streptomyces TaxID=2593676 RepID=UPI00190B55A3|nr:MULTISPECIES: RusA family crossover junction endodeoxyribonuclease [unclassified Streptomyces]MBK3559283.1 RusA family crossover junction endodeoxyribonuclease [Streptomyces sp. MBT56]MBK3601006.1 RusA family crossover junction endodeoxyribonuclease [Streptomyces sp. MBT54]MBK3613912.1 RusA family crossover junction endodeoxyribonuclease [Streptomyces sp. MBT98]MBK6042023.1 RusA family crossover junction endodeoxyribonuclease [Streptomyces sp. MBT55]